MKRTVSVIVLCLACVAFGAGLMYYTTRGIGCVKVTYVNPDFACGNNLAIRKGEYSALRNDVLDYITRQKNAHAVNTVSVYFRDLRDGPTFGINSDADYAPASLLKLPLVMAIFNDAEDDPHLLSVPLTYSASATAGLPPIVQNEKPTPDIQEGGTYPLSDLMRNTIQYSDNLAFFTLVNYMNDGVADGPAILARAFQELGVIDPRTPDEAVVSVRAYGGLFRTLYNASFLNVHNSETLLGWLAHTTYNKGIVGGVPSNTSVAHKFGERLLDDGSKQLHDCGIVYFPENPYIICIMTQGTDWNVLAGVISTISKMVYTEVDSRRVR